jgi:hypothetical protein
MAMIKDSVKNENNVNVTYNVDRVNLYDFGYEKSGDAKGDPDVYATYLNRIINGDLVEENYKGLQRRKKRNV